MSTRTLPQVQTLAPDLTPSWGFGSSSGSKFCASLRFDASFGVKALVLVLANAQTWMVMNISLKHDRAEDKRIMMSL